MVLQFVILFNLGFQARQPCPPFRLKKNLACEFVKSVATNKRSTPVLWAATYNPAQIMPLNPLQKYSHDQELPHHNNKAYLNLKTLKYHWYGVGVGKALDQKAGQNLHTEVSRSQAYSLLFQPASVGINLDLLLLYLTKELVI